MVVIAGRDPDFVKVTEPTELFRSTNKMCKLIQGITTRLHWGSIREEIGCPMSIVRFLPDIGVVLEQRKLWLVRRKRLENMSFRGSREAGTGVF